MSMSQHILIFYLIAFMCGNAVNYTENEYGFVIDAGSTGSRIYTFEWPFRKASTCVSPISEPQEYGDALKLLYPISTLTTYESTKEYLLLLINHAKNITNIFSDRYNTFPIYLKATAGMRVLDEIHRKNIFKYIRQVFNNKTLNPFYFEDNFAIIASGTEEAIFDWISVNYILESYSDVSENNLLTYGALDLGGASTQIAFVPLSTSDIIDGFSRVDVFDYSFRLYAVSHLRYGENEVETQIARKVYLENNNQNPCLNKGIYKIYDIELENLTVINANQTGIGNAILCEEYMRYILDLKQYYCQYVSDECSLNGLYIPSLVTGMKWIAFSGFAYTVSDIKHGLNETSTINEIYNVGIKYICNYTFNELNIVLPGLYSPTTLCMMNLYIVVLLRDGYHFDVNERNILWTESINNQSVGWQWGSILFDANLLKYLYIQNNTIRNNEIINEIKKDKEYYKLLAIIFAVLFMCAA
eukprot:304012_1